MSGEQEFGNSGSDYDESTPRRTRDRDFQNQNHDYQKQNQSISNNFSNVSNVSNTDESQRRHNNINYTNLQEANHLYHHDHFESHNNNKFVAQASSQNRTFQNLNHGESGNNFYELSESDEEIDMNTNLNLNNGVAGSESNKYFDIDDSPCLTTKEYNNNAQNAQNNTSNAYQTHTSTQNHHITINSNNETHNNSICSTKMELKAVDSNPFEISEASEVTIGNANYDLQLEQQFGESALNGAVNVLLVLWG